MSPHAPLRTPGPDLFRLDEMVAVITGAGGAFGRATALGLARAGARSCLTDIDPASLEETRLLVAAEGSCIAVVADASDQTSVDATFAAA